MFALSQLAALCVAAVTPTYTVYVREVTAPERAVPVPLNNGTVCILDAVEALKRSPRDLARMDLWIVRREAGGKVRVLPVDWAAITQRGLTATNYQILDGDRLFLQAHPPK
jgi:polysaccharide export outer membrane protein